MATDPTFPRLLEASCTDRLMRQRQASPHTIARARDPCCLRLRFAQQRLHKAPSTLTLADLDAPFLSAFLEHQRVSGASARFWSIWSRSVAMVPSVAMRGWQRCIRSFALWRSKRPTTVP